MPASGSFLPVASLSCTAALYACARFIRPFAVMVVRIQVSSAIWGTSDCRLKIHGVRIQAARQPTGGNLQCGLGNPIWIPALHQGVIVGQEEKRLHIGWPRWPQLQAEWAPT